MARHDRSCSDHTRMLVSAAEENRSRRAGSGWKATKLQAGGVGLVSYATLTVTPHPPALRHPYSLYDTR